MSNKGGAHKHWEDAAIVYEASISPTLNRSEVHQCSTSDVAALQMWQHNHNIDFHLRLSHIVLTPSSFLMLIHASPPLSMRSPKTFSQRPLSAAA